MTKQKLLASLPSVDEILKSENGQEWLFSYPRRFVLQAVREIIEQIRQGALKEKVEEFSVEAMAKDIQKQIQKLSSFSLKPVINATGVVIHTNLGRSVLSEKIMDNVKKVACGYSTLEYDIEKGQRGKRYSHVQRLINEITGAENSLVVNNNAAAVFVCLTALARGKEVIVSRGELVEIGGSFRVPDVMSASGAILREVGTTNKTHLRDYENTINENTGLLLKVHQSNFRTVGFTKLVEIDELVKLGKKHNIPVMFDLGSGCLIDLKPYGIHIEPSVQEVVKSGCDIITFSGDKLLGGPQGGVIAGKADIIETISKHPLMRAVRVDKMTLSALEAVLMLYMDEEKAKKEIPTLRMLLQNSAEIKARSKKIAAQLSKKVRKDTADINVIADSSQSGGGALPEIEFKTFVVAVKPKNLSVNKLEDRLRNGSLPIIARIKNDALIIDARTISDNEIESLLKGIAEALG
jgi:L-seryl-tRNA(Ser) seleniumtransferase